MNRKLKTAALKGLVIGAVFAFAFLAAQVASNTTFAQLPTNSPGGSINLISDRPQWLSFNTDSHGTRSYVPVGSILATNFVATAQTSTSGSFGDLSTADSVTFSCATTCNVAVLYLATISDAVNGNAACFNSVMVDNVQADDGSQDVVLTAVGFAYDIAGQAGWKASSLSAGSHTIKVQHKATGLSGGGQSCGWRDRMLTATVTQ